MPQITYLCTTDMHLVIPDLRLLTVNPCDGLVFGMVLIVGEEAAAFVWHGFSSRGWDC